MNIAIIGSGLTGSLAAISLAKVGCRVDLYERLTDEDAGNLYRFGLSAKSSIRDTAKIANKWIEYIMNDKISINYTKELESIFYEKMRSFLKKNAFSEPFWFIYHYIKYFR